VMGSWKDGWMGGVKVRPRGCRNGVRLDEYVVGVGREKCA
jgi:hypothetical protein